MNSILQWTPQEASAINDFLNSPIGRKWIQVLFLRSPKITISTLEKTALDGAFAAGYKQFFDEIAASRTFREDDIQSTKPIDMVRD